ncbi:hypothetical protein scyTo_0005648 [Scyliorhinus torazame]|uniref:RNA polymerase-associated protein LEO1 n=1 Tax=Scyliorhinus torazame TaxID=75743 RepID=A0A401PB16_SCYTO|nr:hypothetical protein [Scyliorhinus torazame]
MADMADLFGSDGDSEPEQKDFDSGSGSGSDSEREQAASESNPSGSEREDANEDEDGREAAKPSNKELFGEDSEDEVHSRHSGSDDRSDNQSIASGHSEQDDVQHSETEQQSGSEEQPFDNEDDDNRSDAGSMHSDAGISARDSDSDDEIVRHKPKKLIASDSDSDDVKDKIEGDDLFGGADDISSDSEGEKPPTPGQPVDDYGMDQGHQEEEPIPETRIEVEIPKVNTDLGNDLYFVKLPNFLSVEPRPFDPQYYEDEFEDEEMLDEEGRTRLKLKVENTIRWRVRKDEEGNETRESNARIVKWSDGSMSLHLGNEVFDVYKAPLQGDHNHLFIRQGTGLQGQAVFKTKLTFRPHSTDSATHRKMTLSLADRCSKTQKIRILPMAGRDPESQRSEMIKERARIYSSDSDEGSDDDKAQRLLKAKKLDSDEEAEHSGKRKAENDDKGTSKRAKKYVISDEEEDDV